jgi:hypothetical protein
MEDAIQKLNKLINNPRKNMGKLSNWTSGTIDRCLDIMFPSPEFDTSGEWYRSLTNYRSYVSESKY